MLKKFVVFAVILFAVSTAQDALAANPLGNATSKLNTALRNTGLSNDLPTSIGTVVKALLSVVGTIFLLLTIYAGILWMTAQGNDEVVGKAKGIIQAAVIGLVVVMSAYAITAFITAKVGTVADSSTNTQQGRCDYIDGNGNSACSNLSPNDCATVNGRWISGQVCP